MKDLVGYDLKDNPTLTWRLSHPQAHVQRRQHPSFTPIIPSRPLVFVPWLLKSIPRSEIKFLKTRKGVAKLGQINWIQIWSRPHGAHRSKPKTKSSKVTSTPKSHPSSHYRILKRVKPKCFPDFGPPSLWLTGLWTTITLTAQALDHHHFDLPAFGPPSLWLNRLWAIIMLTYQLLGHHHIDSLGFGPSTRWLPRLRAIITLSRLTIQPGGTCLLPFSLRLAMVLLSLFVSLVHPFMFF